MQVPGHSPDCFVCGFLGVDVQVADGCATADVVLDSRFTGPSGYAHGGITAALFDELMGAAVCDRTPISFTATLTVDYRRPWRIGEPARMTARAEWVGERKLEVRAELGAAAGAVVAEAHGLWVVPRAAAAG